MTRPLTVALVACALAACSQPEPAMTPTPPTPVAPVADAGAPGVPVTSMPGHETLRQDTTPKTGPRLLPAEAYVRSYLALFGGLSPAAVAAAGRPNGLFDTWNDYLLSLGLPDHRLDIDRVEQTSTLMAATFERTGVALCDLAVERDLRGTRPVAERVVFAFALPAGEPDAAAFAERFDVLHRTFLGYPAALAPGERVGRYHQLYRETVARHAATRTRFAPAEAGWAAVCYGLVRHPEFHLY